MNRPIQETTQTPEELVRAYIWAMFEWETSAFEVFEEQVDQRIREKREEGETFIQSVHDAFAESGTPDKEKGWHFIVRNFCTETRSERKCPGYSSPPRHDPVKEKIVSFSLDPYGDAIIRTRFVGNGTEETRHYVLTEEYGIWLIADIFSETDQRRHRMM